MENGGLPLPLFFETPLISVDHRVKHGGDEERAAT
jgi:hypothetical protein